MANVVQIKNIIEALPTLIIYVVPGYIILWIIAFNLTQEINKDNHIILKSLVISYLLVNLIKAVAPIDSPKTIVFILILSVFLGFAISKFITSYSFSWMLQFLKIYRTPQSNIWLDILDFTHGVWARVYIPSEKIIYEGALIKYGQSGDGANHYILLSNYIAYSYESEILEDNSENNTYYVAVNIKDISRIELIYNPKSKKIL
ncbi:DUF6338 family protein [Thermosediminibacter litoriperuensis]|nr:DUF6338 family protein [Thermosediminibacter litoriperuensis]